MNLTWKHVCASDPHSPNSVFVTYLDFCPHCGIPRNDEASVKPDILKHAYEELESIPASAPHYHKTKSGVLVKCYHECKTRFMDAGFWGGLVVGTTVSFPFEHYLYEKVWPFKLLTEWMGL